MTTTYSVTVTQQVTSQYVAGRTQGFRTVIVASAPVGFEDAGVFVFLRTGTLDEYQCVASPSQLADLPFGAPTAQSQGWWRSTTIDITWSAQSIAQDFIAQLLMPLNDSAVQGEVWTLCNEMVNLADNLTVPTSQVISATL